MTWPCEVMTVALLILGGCVPSSCREDKNHDTTDPTPGPIKEGGYNALEPIASTIECSDFHEDSVSDTAPWDFLWDDDARIGIDEVIWIESSSTGFEFEFRGHDEFFVVFDCQFSDETMSPFSCDRFVNPIQPSDTADRSYWILSGTFPAYDRIEFDYSYYPDPTYDTCHRTQHIVADWYEPFNI